MKKKVISNQIPEVLPKELAKPDISEKFVKDHSPIGKKKIAAKKNEKVKKDEVRQSKSRVKDLTEKVVIPITEDLSKIKVITFIVGKRNQDGTVKKANIEVFIPLTTKHNVNDKGKVEKRDYLRAIYEFDSVNDMNDNVLKINNYSEIFKSQFNTLHVALGKLIKEKISEEKEKAIIKAREGLKQLRKEETKKGGKKKISNVIPPKK